MRVSAPKVQAGAENEKRKRESGMRIVLALLFGVCLARSAAGETLNLRYGQAYSSTHSIFSLPISVAEREGLFLRERLDVKVLVPIPGGSDKMIAALHDDEVDLTHVATPFLIRAALAGSDAGQTLDLYFRPERGVLPKHAEIDIKGLEQVIALMSEAGTIKPPIPAADRFVDIQYLHAAGAE
jgi:hypothetical protein